MKKNAARTEYITRDTILKLLSDNEVARVSTAETAAQLVEGDEYVDLEQPDRSVLKAVGNYTDTKMGSVLPRKAVMDGTWRKIQALLAAHRAESGRRPTHSAP